MPSLTPRTEGTETLSFLPEAQGYAGAYLGPEAYLAFFLGGFHDGGPLFLRMAEGSRTLTMIPEATETLTVLSEMLGLYPGFFPGPEAFPGEGLSIFLTPLSEV